MTSEVIIPLRFLVVEDEDRPLEGAIRMLRYLGVSPVAERDAVAALNRFKEAPGNIDAILTDNNMPGMTGIDSVPEYRRIAQEAGLPIRPLFLWSGLSDFLPPKEELMRIGVDEVFSKPGRPSDYKRMDALAREIILARRAI